VLVGLTSYVPTFLERSTGATPIVAGLAVAALTIGWPISASQSGRLYMRIGFRPTALIGLVIATLGALSLWLTSSTPNVWATAGSCLVVGLGLGLVATPTLIAAQASVPWNERAVVTGTNMFMRSVGSAVGVAIFGAIANAVIASRGGDGSSEAVQAGSSAVFLAVLVAATVSIVAGLLMPHTKAEDVAHGGPDAGPSDGEPDQEPHREPDREPDLSADPVT
jgi:MFS family permease